MKNYSLFILILSFVASINLSAQEESSIAKSFKDSSLEWGGCPLPMDCNVTVLHGDISKPDSDIFFKMPAGESIPWHSHSSAERMVLVSGKLEIQYEGEDEKIVKPSSYMYGPSNKMHKGKCVSKDPCIIFIAFNKPVDATVKE